MQLHTKKGLEQIWFRMPLVSKSQEEFCCLQIFLKGCLDFWSMGQIKNNKDTLGI